MAKKTQDLSDPESFVDDELTEVSEPEPVKPTGPIPVDELLIGANVTFTLKGEVIAVNKVMGYVMIRCQDGVKQITTADRAKIVIDS